VIAAGYADKVRRVLFAQLRDKIKQGELSNTDVAAAAGNLNRFLFEIIVNKLRVDKLDVVRIQVDYDVVDGRIEFNLDTLRIEVWRREPQEKVDEVVKESIGRYEEVVGRAIEFEAERVGETAAGDVVYKVIYQGRDVGALLVTPINENEALVRGAVVEPTPLRLPRIKIEFEGDLDEYIRSRIPEIMEKANNVERREADKVVREIMAMVEAAERAEREAEEEARRFAEDVEERSLEV
jgi:hypothetical protein